MQVELFDLCETNDGHKWQNSARWIKYEEHIEGLDHHWGRPHIPFIPFQSVFQLKYLIEKGAIILDPDANNYKDMVKIVINSLISSCGVGYEAAGHMLSLLDVKKSRKTVSRLPSFKTSSTNRSQSVFSTLSHDSNPAVTNVESGHIEVNGRKWRRSESEGQNPDQRRSSKRDSEDEMELCHIYAGHWPEITKPVLTMVRFLYGLHLPELVEPVGRIKFIFILLGPVSSEYPNYHELGRAIGILMSNKKFRELAMIADSKRVLTYAIDNFFNESSVVPMCDIENSDLLSYRNVKETMKQQRPVPKEDENVDENLKIPAIVRRMTEPVKSATEKLKTIEVRVVQWPDPFERTRRPFGGVINDVKYRLPFYLDDFKQALSFQCLTSILFIFCANFANAVAIGEVLGEKTEEWMGVSEILIAHAICGVIWGLFAGQPLCIIAAVGPFLVFEESMFNFCKSVDASFLATRFWIGLWTFIMMTLLAMVEAPFLMKYLTRFTEDIFTGLIAIIFLYAGGKFVYMEFKSHPLQNISTYCTTYASKVMQKSNFTYNYTNFNAEVSPYNQSLSVLFNDSKRFQNSTAAIKWAQVEEKLTNQPDTAMLSLVEFLATFLLAYYLKKIRMSIYFGRTIRRALGDFGVPLALITVTFWDQIVFKDTYIRHLTIESKFDVTDPTKRGWIVNPLGSDSDPMPNWMIPASIVPAILVTILLYAEVEIIEALLAKKDKGLRKPSGFHWDLILCGALAFICSIFGLQWLCPAAVQSLSHLSSLTVMKKTVPGEAPRIDYVLEQRVTTIIIAILHAAAAFLGSVLSLIPTAALFGLFFYLGVMGLMGIQFWHRFVLFFVPEKYFPDETYCQNVLMRKMHFYTAIQFVCFACLWVVNMFAISALAFPFVLMLIAVFRLFVVPKFFTVSELEALDGKPVEKEIKDKIEEENEDFYDQISNHA